ncbi:MAG: DUF4292 domain-containing protein [Proteobacteria bacterium]|nr:DUF4292 domain-containing protein [Pseudomonadota bacterium]
MNKNNDVITPVIRHSVYALLIITSLSLFFVGCALLTKTYRTLPPIDDPHTYLQHVLQRAKMVNHLIGTARLKINSPGGKLSTKGVILAQLPSSLRLETFVFFNQPSFLFATDGNKASLYVPSSNVLYSGEATAEHLSLLFGAQLKSEDIVNLFLGSPRLGEYDPAQVSWKPDGTTYMITASAHDSYRQHVWIDPSLGRIIRYELCNKDGNPVCNFLFNDFKSAGNMLIPYTISLLFPLSRTQITIHYETVDSAELPAKELFSIKPSRDTKLLPLKELTFIQK